MDPRRPTGTHRVGALVFLMAGVMLFAGLVAAQLVLRHAGGGWPAPGTPRLPVRLAGFNTAVILASSLALHHGVRGMRLLDALRLRRGVLAAALLGAAFLFLQGWQWTRLLAAGLGFAGTVYGTTFYLVTGLHALHATSGVVWLLVIAARQRHPWVTERMERSIEVCALYWHFVGLVWAALYVMLYLL
jgi:cytochrome c oxidase subunit 3